MESCVCQLFNPSFNLYFSNKLTSYYAAFYLQDFRVASTFIMQIIDRESKHVCIMNIIHGAERLQNTRPTRLYGSLTKNIPWILKDFCGLKQSVNSVKIACFLLTLVSFICKNHQIILMEANKW